MNYLQNRIRKRIKESNVTKLYILLLVITNIVYVYLEYIKERYIRENGLSAVGALIEEEQMEYIMGYPRYPEL